jgi:hypothetical protein
MTWLVNFVKRTPTCACCGDFHGVHSESACAVVLSGGEQATVVNQNEIKIDGKLVAVIRKAHLNEDPS